jgi:hypothetical protein
VIAELGLSALMVLGPPIAEGPAEGPQPDADSEAQVEPEAEVEPEADAELADSEPAAADETAAIVAEAAIAAQDRAVLERNNREVPEFVRQLDALATVEDRLDTCGRAVQAELRMDLALAYLRAAGTCSEAEPDPDAPVPVLEYPRECSAANDPSGCAALLLERAAEFGDSGPAGAEDPLAQAAGCPHAAESMTVERMFGACVTEEYNAAVERWRASQEPVEEDRKPLDLKVPRWASITGISVGAGAIVAGAVLVAIDGNCPGGGDPMVDLDACPNVYDTEVGGAVLISVGALAMLGMGAILTITEIQNKRRGRSNSTTMRRRMDRVTAVTGWQLPRLQLQPRRRP